MQRGGEDNDDDDQDDEDEETKGVCGVQITTQRGLFWPN